MKKTTIFFMLFFLFLAINITAVKECPNLPGNLSEIAKNKKQIIFRAGTVVIKYDLGKGRASVHSGKKELFREMAPVFKSNGTLYKVTDYSSRSVTKQKISDCHGEGVCFEVKHARAGLPSLLQRFYLYPSLAYFFTETELISPENITVNYMAPFHTIVSGDMADKMKSRMLFVPFDNDKWVQFNVRPVSDMLSYEATALFDTTNRNGLIIGSVEHCNWKTGIKTCFGENKLSAKNNNISSVENELFTLTCFGGVSSELTRDALPHGALRGKRIKSPRIMVGMFSDWREGMEEYAKANARITPSPVWKQGIPFGWNSWGSIQTKINLQNASEVSDFIKDKLQQNHFSNDQTVYIGLDSYWDNFSDIQLKEFVDHCRRNGQKAGIYWAPFADWARNPLRMVEGTQTPYKEVYLYANGNPQDLDGAYAVDPTHPAVKERINQYINRFKTAGFEYIKIDFLTHGALEADAHFDSSVTTGIQAYNEGLRYLNQALDGKFYITMAISPLFPSQYAHSRRIACDAFASITDTEYTLNGLSYGWWLGCAYLYNDPDHLVLLNKAETEGENRARITSGVITGLFMDGDNLSHSGGEQAKERALKFLTVPAVNDIARLGRSFRPVYGYKPSAEKHSEQVFMLKHGNSVYVAVFNFTDKEEKYPVPLTDLGIYGNKRYLATELWSGNTTIQQKTLESTVKGKDVQLWKIDIR